MLAFQDPTGGAWQQLREAFDRAGYDSALTLTAYLVVGGLLAYYVRFLYRRTSRNPAADSVARVFPLLTLVTIAVISVVKSSLSLSLGLVGALSIVRFRAAIKDPEELVYLFLCIGIGLALGAAQPWIALALVVAATLFVLVFERVARRAGGSGEAFVTVIGPAARFAGSGPETALAVVERACASVVVQRCDLDGDEGQLRAQVRAASGGPQQLITALREGLPDCQVSYVDAGALS